VTVSGGILDAAAALGSAPPANTPPLVTISAPSNGASAVAGTVVNFAGSAMDAQDGNLGSSIAWTSSLQGALGTGPSFSRSNLVVGIHLITASATDSGSLTGTAQVTLTISSSNVPPAEPGSVNTTSLNGGSVLVSWTDLANNENGYQVQREERVGNQWRNTATAGTTGPNAESLVDSPGSGRFRYRVRAFNGYGNSNWSGWSNVRIR
jgi:hypothetical protein